MDLFSFDPEKAMAAFLYVAFGLNQSDMHSVFKTLYLADKEHLVKYGRPVVGDRYIAMDHGPVPSEIYDWCKESRHNDKPFNDSFHLKNNSEIITPLVDPDFDELSESDIECLDHAIEIIRPLNFAKRKELSHDKAWVSTTKDGTMNILRIAEAGGAEEDMLNYIKDKLEFEDSFS